jgi:phospholipid-transporting ATPase
VVLACRVSPKQKAEIVSLVRRSDSKVTSLSIGDGANDVNMITAAHIGIGISGLEGQQAARAADYSIGQFRFLKNLLFVHGREAYRRNSYLIIYMFYKNVVYVLPIFFFGIKNFFSGTPIYDVLLYNMYNICFTGLPVCWYACFDQEFTKEQLLTDVSHYKIGLENRCFNPVRFWANYLMAIVQSGLFLFLTIYSLEESNGYNLKIDTETLGEYHGNDVIQGGLVIDGVFMIQVIVVMINLKIFIETNTYTPFSIFLQFGCIAFFYGVMFFFDYTEYNP